MLRKLFKFHGGVHPPEHKLESTATPIRPVPMPEHLVLPLRQHIGKIGKLKVEVGDHVLKGQLLAEASGTISAAVHAPSSGTITAIADQLIPHPSRLPDRCITLETDGEDRWIEHHPVDYSNMGRAALFELLRQSGIVGLGGATFPAHVKLSPNGKQPITTLIINGAECEPFITCDDMLMRERADDIVRGTEIARELLGAAQCIVGIEDNKPQAATAMRQACVRAGSGIEVVVVPTLYPSGDSKRLVTLLTGKEVPAHRLPTDIGIQCFNAATVYTLYRFIAYGEPVLSRIITVTGAVAAPGNYEVPLGTLMEALLQAAGGVAPEFNDLVMGGPMMGFSLPSHDVPVVKGTNCIIAATPRMFPPTPAVMPCIRCARCAEACPVNLQPQELYWFSRAQDFEKALDYNLFDCIECGCCSYVCPSHIPLVQFYRFAKSEIIAQDKALQASSLARERNEFRLQRIEREKRERALKHAQKSAVVGSTETATLDDEKQAAIRAAEERAKVQREETQPGNVDNLSPAVQKEIAGIDALREQSSQSDEARIKEQQEP